MSEMKNRVQGVVGIEVINNVFNADFENNPRQNQNGEFFVNDKALKYCSRKYLERIGAPVFVLKSYTLNSKNQISAKTLEERYESLYGPIKKGDDQVKILGNLLGNVDVINYGIAFSVKENNLSITGPTQVSTGVNLYDNTNTIVINQLSPYKSSTKGDDTTASTLGTKTIVDEAHYFFNINVDPFSLNPYKEFGFFYDKEDYSKIKESLLYGVTALNTQTKINCNNEFGVFINYKENSKIFLPNLSSHIIYKKEDNNIIDISKLGELLNKHVNDIESVELYWIDGVQLNGLDSIDSKIKTIANNL